MLVTVTILNVWWTEWDDTRLSLSLFITANTNSKHIKVDNNFIEKKEGNKM